MRELFEIKQDAKNIQDLKHYLFISHRYTKSENCFRVKPAITKMLGRYSCYSP